MVCLRHSDPQAPQKLRLVAQKPLYFQELTRFTPHLQVFAGALLQRRRTAEIPQKREGLASLRGRCAEVAPPSAIQVPPSPKPRSAWHGSAARLTYSGSYVDASSCSSPEGALCRPVRVPVHNTGTAEVTPMLEASPHHAAMPLNSPAHPSVPPQASILVGHHDGDDRLAVVAGGRTRP
jgi:hypothetical protein